MKLSETTLETFKNFSEINSGLVIKPGNFQRTMKDELEIMAEATLEDEFPVQAGIYDLPQFLGLIKMMDNPNIEWNDNFAVLSDGSVDLTYRYSNANLITTPPDDKLDISDPDAKVVILESQLTRMKKIASALSLPNLFLVGNDQGISLKIDEKDNSDSHKGSLVLSKDPVKEFSAMWLTEHLMIVPGNYNVAISLDGLSIWENENQTRKYYIALQV